jgi:hypothetical protein
MAKEKNLTQKDAQKILSGIKKTVGSKPDPTVKDVMTWLFDGKPEIELPYLLANRQYKLKPLINSVIQKFRTNPKTLNLLNGLINNMHSSHSESQILVFLKSYIQINKITKYMLDQSWFPKSKREIFIEKYGAQKGDLESGFNDVVAQFDLLSTGKFDDKLSLSLMESLETNNLKEKEEIELLNSQLEEFFIKEQENKISNDPRFIKELNEEIIKDLNLSLIDIKSIERTNKILLVFLDKSNLKKYYLFDFVYEFVISNVFSIIGNDYVMPFYKEIHQPYIVTDMKTLDAIKRTLRDERDKFYKQYAWINN